MFVRSWGYTLTHKDPARPWIILETRHEIVELPDDVWFGEWRGSRWPTPEWEVELDPGLHMAWVDSQLGRTPRSSTVTPPARTEHTFAGPHGFGVR